MVILAIIATLIVVFIVLRYAGVLGRLLHQREVEVMSRVFGPRLVAIAVQVVASAAKQWATGP